MIALFEDDLDYLLDHGLELLALQLLLVLLVDHLVLAGQNGEDSLHEGVVEHLGLLEDLQLNLVGLLGAAFSYLVE